MLLRVDAPGLEGVGDIAVCGDERKSFEAGLRGLILRANSMAGEFSDWGPCADRDPGIAGDAGLSEPTAEPVQLTRRRAASHAAASLLA